MIGWVCWFGWKEGFREKMGEADEMFYEKKGGRADEICEKYMTYDRYEGFWGM